MQIDILTQWRQCGTSVTNEFERIPILPIKPLRIKKVPEAEERIMFKTLAWKTHKWVLSKTCDSQVGFIGDSQLVGFKNFRCKCRSDATIVTSFSSTLLKS